MKNRIQNFPVGFALAISLGMIVVLLGCQASNTTKVGVIEPGVSSGVLGHQSINTAVGAIIGATVGGTSGALIGRHMDRQAEELKKDLGGATVQRVGEGILITINLGYLFKHDSFGLGRTAKDNLSELSRTLNKYDDTKILIEGHTDNTGEDSYNLSLSQKRAIQVENFLIGNKVSSDRINTHGYGDVQPLSDNTTSAGRQSNRRIEVAIYANKEMITLAEKGKLGFNDYITTSRK